jgi:hypothetical protein
VTIFFERRTLLRWTKSSIWPIVVKSLLSLALISYQHFPEFIATSLAAMFEGRLYGSKLDFCCREGVMGRNVNAARQAGRNAIEWAYGKKSTCAPHGLIFYS